MTDYGNLQAQIADYANRQDWSPALVQFFITCAQEKFNAELRVDRMIQNDMALIASRCAPLPDNWLEMDLVSIADPSYPSGFAPLVYKPRDEFYRTNDNYAAGQYECRGLYTISGRNIVIGGAPDTVNGQQVRISYYGEVPVFSDTNPSWIYTKYPSLYLYASLMHADLHAVGEEDKAGAMKQLTEDGIQKLNAQHRYARASGSRLSRSRIRSFG